MMYTYISFFALKLRNTPDLACEIFHEVQQYVKRVLELCHE